MKKNYIIIGILTLLIIILTILILKTKKRTNNIEQVNNNLDTEIKEEVKQEIEEESKEESKEEEKCEAIDTPLMSKTGENGYPIFDSKGPITEEKLKEIIDNQLSFIIYKNNYQEITNKDIFYRALIASKMFSEETFTKEQLNEGLEKTVLSNLKLKHESHYTETGYNYIYENGIYTLDDSNYEHVDAYDEHPIYGEVQSLEENNGIYKINIKYLWVAGNYEPTSNLYKNRYDSRKKINKIQMPNNVKCYSKWLKENFKKYEKDLPTYTYSFKEVNNHIYLVDFYITDNN